MEVRIRSLSFFFTFFFACSDVSSRRDLWGKIVSEFSAEMLENNAMSENVSLNGTT